MPCGFVDDPEGDIADEKVDDGGFGDDILAADADGINVLLLNVRQHHAAAVTDDLCQGIDSKSIGCVPKSLLHVRSVHVLAFIRKSDIALCDGNGVHGPAVQQHLPLPGLGVEDRMNIYPAEIEAVLKQDPRVKEALVYGFRNQFGIQIGLKLAGDFDTVEQVKELCIQVLPSFQVPSAIELVDELPKNGSGKVIRKGSV